ncbi:MAG: hypothetical protein Q8N79_10135 [Candidatus Methanoperedens sp.]|nr:hypothetical protein [Candidatus Methanoperedens sp.]
MLILIRRYWLTFNYSVMVIQKPINVQVGDGRSSSNQTIFVTALDATPPAGVTALMNSTYEKTFIN